MVANRVLVVTAVCSVLFACAPVRADDKKPTESKKVAEILETGIDAGVAADFLKEHLPYAEFVRIPLFNAVLVWGTEEELAYIRRVLRPL